VNALTLLIGAALFLIIAYRLYGSFMAAKVLALDETRPTPAHTHTDGKDYVPTNKWVVFGHHFAAIAGAGPLVGPVLAAQFGYAPGALWILLGSVLAGAVHDIVITFSSVRHEGKSIAEIAHKELGSMSGWLTSLAVLMILIITMAGLALTVVHALYASPWGFFTVAVTIPIALLMGLYSRYIRPGRIGEATVIGVGLLALSIIYGPTIAHSGFAKYLTFNAHQLTVIIAVYGFVAAALPVWLLLAPRDYLSTYLKIGTILALAVGIAIVRPVLQMPAVTDYIHGGGPIIPGQVWPFMFITIACGAMSGFHAIIGTGTTPKMIDNERDLLPVTFGGMLVEAFVALMALIAVSSMHPADYFAINTSPEVFAHLGMAVKDLPVLGQLVGENVAARPGGAVSLAVGMAKIFASIPGLNHLLGYWYHFCVMFEALFILTAIDAGTRVGRYLLQEMGGAVWKPLRNHDWWPGILATSGLISLIWGYLVYGGSIGTVWPLFGVGNQLLGSLGLAIGTTVIIRMGKGRYAWTTIVPLAFLTVTTVAAGYLNIVVNYLPQRQYLLAGVSGLMVVMVVVVVGDSIRTWLRLSRRPAEPVYVEAADAEHRSVRGVSYIWPMLRLLPK
jgi:carbon starvation protein